MSGVPEAQRRQTIAANSTGLDEVRTISGPIWSKPVRVRAQIVRRVCEALERSYGMPRLGNPEDPLDDLIYIVISNKTSPKIAQSTYERVRQRFKPWDEVLSSRPSALRCVLRPAGRSPVKSRQIRAALRRIEGDFGSCNLAELAGESEQDTERYLVSLPGVSEKVAKCVMMFTLGAQVLPVDAHVHRIAKRLGWTARKRPDQCHQELEALVPGKRRYAFHVGCVMHGRIVCRPRGPTCEGCCISRHCVWREGGSGHE